MEVLKNNKKAASEIKRAIAHGNVINYILIIFYASMEI